MPTLFEQARADPEAYHVIYQDDYFTVMPDQFPVVKDHLLLASDKAVGQVEELDPLYVAAAWDLATVFRVFLKYRLGPKRGVALAAFGNQIGNHMHLHIVPRDSKTDGALFFEDTNPPRAPEMDLEQTKTDCKLTSEVDKIARERVNIIMTGRIAELKPVASLITAAMCE